MWCLENENIIFKALPNQNPSISKVFLEPLETVTLKCHYRLCSSFFIFRIH